MRKLSAMRPKKVAGSAYRHGYCMVMDTKCLHITGTQAIKLLRAARAKNLVTAMPADETRVQPFGTSVSSLSDFGVDGLLDWLNICPQNPLAVLVPGASSRSWATGIKNSVLSRDVPRGSFMELRDGRGDNAIKVPSSTRVLIDSPQLALIHACDELWQKVSDHTIDELEALLRLVALASEFCGSYARDPLRPKSGSCYYDKPGECGRFVTPSDLHSFLSVAPSIGGLALARRVAKFAIDESGSPMETYINHALTLPPRMAGLSMEKPLANKELVVDPGVKGMLKHNLIRPDFQWPDYKMLAEYLGDKDHASRSACVEDKNRSQDYTVSDYRALFLMFDDVRCAAALNRTATTLARGFAKGGKKFEPHRIRRLLKDPDFKQRQTKLIATLLPPVLRYEQS